MLLLFCQFTGRRISPPFFVDITRKKGLGRFRREALNLGREAYKGTSSPKFGGRKSPYNMENFEEIQPIPVSFSKFSESGTFLLFPTGFFSLVKCDSPVFA